MIDKRKMLGGIFYIIAGLILITLVIISLTTTQTLIFEKIFRIVAIVLFGGIGILFIIVGVRSIRNR